MKKYAWHLILFGLFFCACSTAQLDIGYPYYVIHPEVDKLEGHDPKGADDLTMSATCDPDPKNQAKCIAMLEAKFYDMAKELLELRTALKECQQGASQ